MLSRILIANRGEIALRILRTCREMEIDTVCVYSDADRDAIYLRHADESVCIGPPPSTESYLDVASIVSAAEITDVEAIHPGYGFLSENAHFAEICESCRITFIGPSAEAIAMMGDKSQAKDLAREAGVPVIPGSEGPVEDEQAGLDLASEIGYPVMIKASAGGGGRGMRVAHNNVSFVNAFVAAQSEAEAAFKSSELYIEKFIDSARHVEIQVLSDRHGNHIHLGERDCTIQRRHQKLIEEAPSPAIDEETRARMGQDAVKLARAADYEGAGTVEFLVDREGNHYFIEMNTRIQVEHPVTEMVYGIDLIREQIRVASGLPLSIDQADVEPDGWAMECRINAEDPRAGFKPSPGDIGRYFAPGGPGVRVDSHAYAGYRIPPHYDSLLGKLIVHRRDRDEVVRAMKAALGEYVIEDVETTIPLYLDILRNVHFIRGEYDTNFVETHFT